MPVSFFVDPQIVADKDAFQVEHITLSYTFYPAAPPKSAGKSGDPATPQAVQPKGQAG
jgi:cytochrome c oxidase assembly protein subunit 11